MDETSLKTRQIDPTFSLFADTVLRPTEAAFTVVDSTWKKLAPFFPYFRIYCVTAGHATLYFKNQKMELNPGNLYFIPSFSIVTATCEDSMSHYWLHFNLDLKTSNYLRLIKPLTAVKATKVDEMVFKLLIENIGNVSPSQKMACSGLATYLFSKFFAIDKIDFEKIRFFNVLKYIEEHLHETITNQQLADIMYLNPNYFSSLFVKKFGLSSKQYIIEQKLTLASKMLLESDKTVKQIAYDLGYNNETYFNKLFRSYTGVTPGKYRQTLQKK